jgi:hypothetical protein
MNVDEIISENKLRLNRLFCPYDPITGVGSLTERKPVFLELNKERVELNLPVSMFSDPVVSELESSGLENMLKNAGVLTDKGKIEIFNYLHELRLDHDFEYYAFLSLYIKDKESPNIIQFKLNLSQRMLLKEIEAQRLAQIPIRIDDLKSRQLGGSTLFQAYMFWIQVRLMPNWHSAICTQVEAQAKNIRGMFNRFSKYYPSELGQITLLPYEGSKNKIIKERGNIIGVGSNEEPDNLRSFDFSMLHISELGLWKSTILAKPEDLIQGLVSSVPSIPMTMIFKESTAKGIGNYWHETCLLSMQGKSAYKFVFMPWYTAERYTKQIEDYKKFINSMSDYDKFQWEAGATLEGINYYKNFRIDENYSEWRMQSEFPTTPEEAFQSTGHRAFEPIYVIQNKNKNVIPPFYVGTLKANSRIGKESLNVIHFVPDPKGDLFIWAMPDTSLKVGHRYLVSMDIGGRGETADKTVLTVFDRYWLIEGGYPEIVARWRLNIDQDIAAWMGAGLAKWYNNALFVVEFNSLRNKNDTLGEHSLTILDTIVDDYPNIYTRTDPEKVKEGIPVKYGFHTNKKTKGLIIDGMNAALREMTFIDPDVRFYNEADSYEEKPDGSYGAVDGTHDDILMSTAIGLWISEKEMPMPYIIKENSNNGSRKIANESTF